ncbi:hypothetical protein PIB30_027661 [Stylosanthes scabra]|uniref:Uncharacterized protein n=1 Tax=Stylosanthes scabra TaxID=79078 RepID=A0ABU6SAX9_9FABA|nr:hypothetical protein [Stylosanthes scabra]
MRPPTHRSSYGSGIREAQRPRRESLGGRRSTENGAGSGEEASEGDFEGASNAVYGRRIFVAEDLVRNYEAGLEYAGPRPVAEGRGASRAMSHKYE